MKDFLDTFGKILFAIFCVVVTAYFLLQLPYAKPHQVAEVKQEAATARDTAEEAQTTAVKAQAMAEKAAKVVAPHPQGKGYDARIQELDKKIAELRRLQNDQQRQIDKLYK